MTREDEGEVDPIDHVDFIDDTLDRHGIFSLCFTKMNDSKPSITLLYNVDGAVRAATGYGTDFASALEKALEEKRLSLLNETNKPSSEVP